MTSTAFTLLFLIISALLSNPALTADLHNSASDSQENTPELSATSSHSADTPNSQKAIKAPEVQLTPFTAHYITEWKLGWFSIDIKAKRELKRLPNTNWQLTFVAETGAAKLKETSELSVKNQRIQPLHYRYRASGLFNEDDRTLKFLPESKSVLDQEKNKTHSNAWETEVQDNLTYMLQAGLDLAAGKTEFTYPVFEKNTKKPFRFRVIGEEVLKTKAGTLTTVKVMQVREDKNREVYAWFDKDKHFLLVRLLDKKKGKKRYEINVTDIRI